MATLVASLEELVEARRPPAGCSAGQETGDTTTLMVEDRPWEDKVIGTRRQKYRRTGGLENKGSEGQEGRSIGGSEDMVPRVQCR